MSPEEQRIAIAEVRGWKRLNGETHAANWPDIDYVTGKTGPLMLPPGEVSVGDIPPDYPRDLNAMHEAEKTLLSVSNRGRYHKYLTDLFEAESLADALCHATAVQRAEAFLKTVGAWKGTP